MLESFLSSSWFSLSVIAVCMALVYWPVKRVSAQLRKNQSQREAQALALAQAAMVEWRKKRPAPVSQDAGLARSSE